MKQDLKGPNTKKGRIKIKLKGISHITEASEMFLRVTYFLRQISMDGYFKYYKYK